MGIDFCLCACYSLCVPQKWGVGLKFGVYNVPREKRSLMAPFFLDILRCSEYTKLVPRKRGVGLKLFVYDQQSEKAELNSSVFS
nr:MAG TPA: hypothetical protein [Caudoviricetes sp.]